MSSGRENWNSRLGFILAAVGSTVGLGNMWRFPYMVAQNGGAAFVFLFVVLLIGIGLPVMVAEFVLGRGSGRSPVLALSQFDQPNWSWLGVLFVGMGFWLLSYYSVVAGWTVRYAVDAFTGRLFLTEAGSYFAQISFGHEALLFHLLFMVLTIGIVLGGVTNGIERSVKILVPLLLLMMLFLVGWSLTQPGVYEGLSYYLWPEPENLFETYRLFGARLPFLNLTILGSAAGQAFFTLSLGIGCMITYASYLDSDRDLFRDGALISLSDLIIALLAGCMVFPLLIIFGLLSVMENHEISTLFESIHAAVSQFGGWTGQGLGVFFFATLAVASLTSAISFLEVVVSSLIDLFDVDRKRATVSSGVLIFLLGIPAAYRSDWLAFADGVAANLLILFGGLMMSVYVGWLMDQPERELARGQSWDLTGLWLVSLRYFVIPVLFLLFSWNLYDVVLDLMG